MKYIQIGRESLDERAAELSFLSFHVNLEVCKRL